MSFNPVNASILIINNIMSKFFVVREYKQVPILSDDDIIRQYSMNKYIKINTTDKNDKEIILLYIGDDDYSNHSPQLRKLLIGYNPNTIGEIMIIADAKFSDRKNMTSVVKEIKESSNLNIQIYPMETFIINPTESKSVPKHRILSAVEKQELFKELRITIKDLPGIKSSDPVIIWIGAVQGDVIEILRPSSISGLNINYRRVD